MVLTIGGMVILFAGRAWTDMFRAPLVPAVPQSTGGSLG
jgi:hypothetical protein